MRLRNKKWTREGLMCITDGRATKVTKSGNPESVEVRANREPYEEPFPEQDVVH